MVPVGREDVPFVLKGIASIGEIKYHNQGTGGAVPAPFQVL